MIYADDLRRAQKFEQTDTLYVVVWQAYGEWKGTSPFASKEDAAAHAKRWLEGESYNKLITIVPFPKP